MANAKVTNAQIKNVIYLRGMIASIKGNAETGRIRIACPFTFNKRVKKDTYEIVGKVNYPIAIFEETTETKDIMKNFKRGDHVVITAHAQSRFFRTKDGNVERVHLVIDSIVPEATKSEEFFGVKGRLYHNMLNEGYFTGIVAGITKRAEHVYAVRVDLSTGARKNYVNLVCFNAPKHMDTYKIGDPINFIAMVQTIDTSSENPVRGDYQELVILDVVK